MLRKHIFKAPPNRSVFQSGEIDIAASATVYVSSEDSAHPIDNVFDHRRGPGEAIGWRKSRVSKRCCWRLIHLRPFTRLSWKLRNRKLVERKNSGCLLVNALKYEQLLP